MKTKWRVDWVATPAVGLCSNPQSDPGNIMPPKLPGAGRKPVVPAGECTSPCSQARSMASSTSDSLGCASRKSPGAYSYPIKGSSYH